MIISAAKLAANRANAELSTSPKTEEGKATVSKNALRHGLSAAEVIVRDGEREEFETLQAELLEEVSPEGTVESLLFQQLLHSAWNLRRVRRLEAALFDGSTDPLLDDALEQKMQRLARYHACFERTFHRALKELKLLQTNSVVNTTFREATGTDLLPLAAAAKVTKQTQKLHAEDLYSEIFRIQQHRDEAFLGRALVLEAREKAVGNAAQPTLQVTITSQPKPGFSEGRV
jgi:hypothetical protein